MTQRLSRTVPRLALNQREAADALGMGVDTFHKEVRPHVAKVYVGAKVLYPVVGLQRWLDENSARGGRRAA